MLRFWRMAGKENPTEYKHPTTKKWFDKAESHSPVSGTDYGWVWEYARMRFSAAERARRDVEDKSLTTVKFVSALAAGAWAVFLFVVSRGYGLSSWVRVPALVACVFTVAAGLLSLLAFGPSKHVLPVDEETAVECAESRRTKDEAICKFCLGFAASTAREFDLASKKGRWLRWALIALSLAVIGFILSLLCAVLR